MPTYQLSQYCNRTAIPTWKTVPILDFEYCSTLIGRNYNLDQTSYYQTIIG